MRIISIANQKGGAGKTTTALNIGAGLALKGRRVLLIDMDAQRNLSIVFGNYGDSNKTIVDIYDENAGVSLDDIAIKINDNLSIIKGSKMLSGTEKGNQSGDEWILSDKIDETAGEYDYIIIDTPPMNGFLTTSALLASTDVIIPAQPDLYSYQGTISFLDSIAKIKKKNNPELNIMGVIVTRLKNQTISGKEMIDSYDALCKERETQVLGCIPENIALTDSQLSLMDVFAWDKDSKGAKAYMDIVEKIMTMED